MSNPRCATGFLLGLAVLCTASTAASAGLKVRVLDRAGHPVTDVVVAAQLQAGVQAHSPPAAPKVKSAIMDQVDKQFVPRILVIQTGTSVAFPNSDSVGHQVYSFSDAKRFKLELYHGHKHPPLVFDKSGLVVVGCNIHDNMIAYIYVTPTPHFGKTDASGSLTLPDLPAGDYELSIWSPRFNEPDAQIKRKITVTAEAPASLEVRLAKPLRPEAGAHSGGHDY